MTREKIFTFLHFGYLPDASLSDCVVLRNLNLTEWRNKKAILCKKPLQMLIKEGVLTLKRAIQKSLHQSDRGNHIVLLSGGLDSRAILGELIEILDRKDIIAVTFGTPGTWDFEIPKLVARTAGVHHECIDLTSSQWKWDFEGMVKTAAQMETPTWLFDAYVHYHIPQYFGAECIYWSGFMGGAVAGSLSPQKQSASWEEAVSRFVERERFSRSCNLTPPSYDIKMCLPAEPLIDSSLLCYDEQLDVLIAQDHAYGILFEGYNYRTPFVEPGWLEYILSIPDDYRRKEKLYKEILKAAYPRLFSLPTKANQGLPLDAPFRKRALRLVERGFRAFCKRVFPRSRWGVSLGISYIDFDRGLRERNDLKAIVFESIQSLKKRRIIDWIDIDDIWHRHQHKQGNYADALILLSSLEMNIVAGRITL